MYTIAYTDANGALYSTSAISPTDARDEVIKIEDSTDRWGLGVATDTCYEWDVLWDMLMERIPFSRQYEKKGWVPDHVGDVEYTCARCGEHSSFESHLDAAEQTAATSDGECGCTNPYCQV